MFRKTAGIHTEIVFVKCWHYVSTDRMQLNPQSHILSQHGQEVIEVLRKLKTKNNLANYC